VTQQARSSASDGFERCGNDYDFLKNKKMKSLINAMSGRPKTKSAAKLTMPKTTMIKTKKKNTPPAFAIGASRFGRL
jgi:hypothetical protein